MRNRHICFVVDQFADKEHLWDNACSMARTMPDEVTIIGRATDVARRFRNDRAKVNILKKGSPIPEGVIVVNPMLTRAQREAGIDQS